MSPLRLLPVLMLLSGMGLTAQETKSAGREGGIAKVGDAYTAAVREVWVTPGNSSLRDFDDLVGWRKVPDTTEKLPGMAFSEDSPETKISRLTTWFEAPSTGDLFFWISSRGATKLVVSQPDSVLPMTKGGLLYIKDSLGWPKEGQWDLYPSQRLGPVAVEQGRHYLLEIWHGGQPGLKRCEISWSYSEGSPLENWAATAMPSQGKLGPDGKFAADPAPPEQPAFVEDDPNANPYGALFPDAMINFFAAPGDGMEYDFGGAKPVQRLSFTQTLRPDKSQRQPALGFRAIAYDASGSMVAETRLQPEAEPMSGRLEWELPAILNIAKVIIVLGDGDTPADTFSPPIPYQIEAWGPLDGQSPVMARHLIPSASLTGSKAGPGDEDGNGLNDAWEQQHPIRKSSSNLLSAGGDDDGDGLLNQMESLADKDPLVPDSLGYRLTAEYWFDLPRSDVAGLTSSDKFFSPPDLRVVRFMDRASPLPKNAGLRLRGTFTPAVSGDYQFWIAARNAGELWISDDENKFRKYRIASLSPSEGSGHGISRNVLNQWDQFAGQASRVIRLEAGKSYFMEALAQQGSSTGIGQLNLAFAPPGGSRRTLDSTLLRTYLQQDDDRDDDYLPDDWESLFGLDPADNGLTDRARQGERGDFDSDGLSNLLEYQLGTDPSNPDTDGDGQTDGAEYHTLGTDPLSAELRGTKDVITFDPAAFTSSSLSWHSLAGALHAGNYRGTIDWAFEVTEPGYYGYKLGLSLNGQTLIKDTMSLAISIDGTPAARSDLAFNLGQPTTWTVAGPWLTAGRHTLRLLIDNTLVRRSLAIHSLSVFLPEGPDFNRDGLTDWYARALAADGYSVRPTSPISRISPVCLEGTAPGRPETVTLNDLPVHPLGDRQWYANVTLEAGPNVIQAALPGQLPASISVTWQSTNVLEDATYSLRVGDSLLLSATTPEGQAVTANCISSEGVKFGVKNGTAHRFDSPGTVTLSSKAAGLKGTLTVHVAYAVLTEKVSVIENSIRSFPFPIGSVSDGVVLGGTTGMAVTLRSDSILVLPSLPGSLALMARLGPDGPILDACQVRSIRVVDATMHNATEVSLDHAPKGYLRIHAPLLVWELPDRASVQINIFRGGMMFTDGTNRKTLHKLDFDENGLLYLDFLFPNGLSGGYCHYIEILDEDGTTIGRR